MRPLRVYVDTSVVGGCCDHEFAAWSNGLMKDFELGRLQPVISDLVLEEVHSAPEEVLEKIADLRELPVEWVATSPEAETLAREYIHQSILTPNYFSDALHIAIATIAKVDVLVSWNFRHIVHYDKIRLFNAVNLQQGYGQLEIRSPKEVTYYDL
ncbi:MAG: type II toxin-antitoxin system VapC family toxin [Phycisphaerae bacterium]|nr:type II toxin-antitoxin system VapC family toxin [Phycisphaerae bacterium]